MFWPDKLLNIDTGMNTGLCYWRGDGSPDTHLLKESPCNSKLPKIDRIILMTSMLDSIIHQKNWRPNYAIIEDTELWSGSLVSMTATKRGDTFMLAQLAAAYAIMLWETQRSTIKLVMPREWRGQLPESALQSRIQKVLPSFDVEENEHITDAVGMGISACGLLDHRINLLEGWM